ncbi:TPA: restriction endonuclease subunit S [Legionella pneumophila]|nr:restriction endonuclease subunit S [Legionella pneumophila]HAU1457953.1 restriction endonuclease subunit S [Legionella pneumophila]HAU1911597.1 restriction endonuclease subunit S [Legionella pneumophila]HBD7086875.1 restriction endonuclease subunit S [Legionella pneumophila]HBI5727573.1 restriction endonuclease subunit S [Legionella pneumophila]
MVPETWKLSTIGEISNVASGGTPSRKNENYWGGHIPWVTTAEVQFGTIFNTSEKITEAGLTNSSAKLFPVNTILMAMYGQGKTRGQVAKLGIEATTNQACAAIMLKNEYDVDYYFQFLISRYKHIRDLSNSGGQENLSAAIVKSIQVPVPPLPEQKKIAQILSKWDRAITITEKLLANSEQQKKALMQLLLTGKIRFPHFHKEWESKYLIDVAKVIVSPVDKKSIEGEEHVLLCNYTDVYYNYEITRKINFMPATATRSEIEKFTLQEGDVIITKDSETPSDIAIPALVSEDLKGVVCGYHLAIVRPKKKLLDGAFLNYLFAIPQTRYYFFSLASGATRFGLSINGINKAHFKLPSLEEQQQISLILSTISREIEVLQEKLKCLKKEKKALMQQLLTGKKRVKVVEINNA